MAKHWITTEQLQLIANAVSADDPPRRVIIEAWAAIKQVDVNQQLPDELAPVGVLEARALGDLASE